MGVVKLSTAGIKDYQKYSAFLAGNSDTYWFFFITNTEGGAQHVYGFGNDVDVLENTYAVGEATFGNGNDYAAYAVKCDKDGNVIWQHRFNNDGAVEVIFYAASTSADGNLYVAGSFFDSSPAKGVLVKYSSDGSIIWQRKLVGSASASFYASAIDSNNAVIVSGSNILAKYNSSGVLQWQKSPASGTFFYQCFVDSSDNIYTIGREAYVNAETISGALLRKYDSSGTLQWQRYLRGDTPGISHMTQGVGCVVNSSGDVFVLLDGRYSSTYYTVLAKYNSGGTIQWQRVLAKRGATAMTLLPDGDVVILTSADGASAMARYSPDGTIQWQREMGATAQTASFYDVACDSRGNLFFTGEGQDDVMLNAKLPSDGSLTGTYSLGGLNLFYQVSSFTEGAGSFSEGASSYSDTTPEWEDVALVTDFVTTNYPVTYRRIN